MTEIEKLKANLRYWRVIASAGELRARREMILIAWRLCAHGQREYVAHELPTVSLRSGVFCPCPICGSSVACECVQL